MIVKFTARVKDAPEFKEGMGAGVVGIEEYELEDKYGDTLIAAKMVSIMQEMMHKYFEVEMEEVNEKL